MREKSGKTRRRNRAIQTRLGLLLAMKPNMDIVPDDLKAALSMAGFDEGSVETNDDLLVAATYVRALSDTGTLKYLDELMGRSPAMEIRREEMRMNREKLRIYKQRALGKVDLDSLIDSDDVHEQLAEMEPTPL